MKRTFSAGFSSRAIFTTLLCSAMAIVLAIAVASPSNPGGYVNTNGDFILGFRQVGLNNSILVDIGPISDFSSPQTFSLGSLASLLSSTFGSGWASDPTVYFSLAATTRPQDGTSTVNYVTSPGYPSASMAATIWPGLTPANSRVLQNKIINCGNDFNNFTVESGTNAVVEPSTSPDAYQNFMPGGTTDAGHAGQGNIGWGFFNPTPEGNFQYGPTGVVLALVEINPGVGTSGTDLGNFTLSADGSTLTYSPGSSVGPTPTPTPTPEPTPTPTPSPTPIPGAPVISSAASAAGQVGLPFTYQIMASESPASYSAAGLPAGLTLDPVAGAISGAPSASGAFTVTLTATNAAGSGQLTLTITVAGPPTVTLAVAGDADVPEGTNGKAVFARTGDDESLDLPVSYLIKGTAKNGKNYPELSGTVTIPAGTGKFKLKIPINVRSKSPAGKTIILKLAPSPTGAYTIGSPKKAIITLEDNN